MNNGLDYTTDLGAAKCIIGIDTLDQLYLILRDSPALAEYYDISWNHKIIYQAKQIEDTQVTQMQTKSHKDGDGVITYTVSTVTDDDMEFRVLHKLAVEAINKWAAGTAAKPDGKWMQWRKWLHAGLKPLQHPKQIRHILGITSIQEYVQKLQPYTAFQDTFVLYDPVVDNTIRYSYHGPLLLPKPDDFVHFATTYDVTMYCYCYCYCYCYWGAYSPWVWQPQV